MGARVERFAERARRYCTFIENAANFPLEERLRRAASLLAELYAAGLDLPDVEVDVARTPKPPPDLEETFPGFGAHEPYWAVFDPYEPDQPVSTTLSDDLLDVYRDIHAGLTLYEADPTRNLSNAVMDWRLGLESHWGDHATDALRVLQRAMQRTVEMEPERPIFRHARA